MVLLKSNIWPLALVSILRSQINVQRRVHFKQLYDLLPWIYWQIRYYVFGYFHIHPCIEHFLYSTVPKETVSGDMCSTSCSYSVLNHLYVSHVTVGVASSLDGPSMSHIWTTRVSYPFSFFLFLSACVHMLLCRIFKKENVLEKKFRKSMLQSTCCCLCGIFGCFLILGTYYMIRSQLYL